MLTERQRAVLDFILAYRRRHGCSPSIPEIQKEFSIRSPNGVVGHLLALESKGLIRRARRGSRQIDVTGPLETLRSPVFDLPLYSQIPTGWPDEVAGKPEGCVSVDEKSLGFRPGDACFGLKVRGDSMQEAGIFDGDLVVAQPAANPRAGQIVVALIEGESTLKRLVRVRGKWFLKTDNPAYPDLYPRAELTIQGVVKAVIRRLD